MEDWDEWRERESGKSVFAARLNDDDDDDTNKMNKSNRSISLRYLCFHCSLISILGPRQGKGVYEDFQIVIKIVDMLLLE